VTKDVDDDEERARAGLTVITPAEVILGWLGEFYEEEEFEFGL
jgi:hypothetical protein